MTIYVKLLPVLRGLSIKSPDHFIEVRRSTTPPILNHLQLNCMVTKETFKMMVESAGLSLTSLVICHFYPCDMEWLQSHAPNLKSLIVSQLYEFGQDCEHSLTKEVSQLRGLEHLTLDFTFNQTEARNLRNNNKWVWGDLKVLGRLHSLRLIGPFPFESALAELIGHLSTNRGGLAIVNDKPVHDCAVTFLLRIRSCTTYLMSKLDSNLSAYVRFRFFGFFFFFVIFYLCFRCKINNWYMLHLIEVWGKIPYMLVTFCTEKSTA